MDITHDQLQNAFVLFMGCLFVFVLIREVICWYWKINERVKQGDEIIKQLQQLNLHNANLALSERQDGIIFKGDRL